MNHPNKKRNKSLFIDNWCNDAYGNRCGARIFREIPCIDCCIFISRTRSGFGSQIHRFK